VVGARLRPPPGLVAALGLLLGACDPGVPQVGASAVPRPAPTTAVRATELDPGPIKTAAEYLREPELAAADAARGEALGLACAACHRFRAEEGTLIGPHLQGVFGRPAASIDGFAYSEAHAARVAVPGAPWARFLQHHRRYSFVDWVSRA
jgi:mono/diheme cytochrome c family protein